MTNEEAKEIFLNRGFVNGLFDGDKWRQSIVVISKWLEQEPCDDCRNCNKWSECECGEKGHKNGTSIGYYIGECKDYEPCEDCISRKDTLKKFKQIYFDNDTVIRCAELILGSMPPITPKPKTDTWSIKEVADALEKHGLRMSEISEIEIKSMTKEQNYMRGYEDGKSDVLEKIRAEISKSKTEHEMQLAKNDIKGKLLVSHIYCDIVSIFDKCKAEKE